MPDWTPKQLDAIEARNRSILVSAAAGSGKTTVLIERVMSLLRAGATIDRMLVVTFTRAAASEMRERLQKSLTREARQNRALKKQRDLLGSADISTLHQFCIKIIKQHFQAVDADPMGRVGDEGLLKGLLDRAVQEEMELLYETPDADGQQLIDQYKDTQIDDMLRRLYGFLRAQEAPWTWIDAHLARMAEEPPAQQPWYRYALRAAIGEAKAAASLARQCIALAERPDGPARYLRNAQADLEAALAVAEHLAQKGSLPAEWSPQVTRLSTAKAPEQEDPALREQFKAMRDALKDHLKAAFDALPRGEEALEKAVGDIAYTLPALRALAALTRRVHALYGEYKAERQLWDYPDLEQLALACLDDPQVRYQVHQQYDALFVDEYQDISRIQEAIIRRLHGDHATLFMVGDVKQSIYRFRLADPSLFLRKYSAFDPAPDAPERVITLSQNFRSRDNILQAVNHVFEHTLRGGGLEIDYDAEAQLYPGAHSQQDPAVELHLILPPGEDEEQDEEGEQLGGTEREAVLIAERMAALRGTKIQEGDTQRALTWRDMVILLRSASGRAERMAQVLRARGIPVYSDADNQFFDVIEVVDALNLLHVLDNPLDDERLLGVLAAPPFEFSPEELARVRTSHPDRRVPYHQAFFALADSDPRVAHAAQTLERWRFLCENMPLEGFIRGLLRETGIYARAGAKPQGELRRANLRLLCERAGPNPEPQTLHGFLSRVTQARKQDTTRAAATLGASEDVVRIMTIHKSKGLEFPVVFLPDLARRFRLGSQGELLLLDAELGPALKLIDRAQSMTYHTLAGRSILMKMDQETRSEEARLLYVAMTRARERLVMLSAPGRPDSERKRWAMAANAEDAAHANSMLEWVGGSLWPALESGLDALWTTPNGSRWQVSYRSAATLGAGTQEGQQPDVRLSQQQPSDRIREMLAPLPAFPGHPLKLSVTQLVQRSPDPIEETAPVKRLPLEQGPRPLPDFDELRARRALGVQRGVATHRAMGGLALDNLRAQHGQALYDALVRELARMEQAGVLLPKEREAVDVAALSAFYGSAMGQRLLAATQVEREWPFSLMAEERMILQGVLDCCFMEDGAWVVIDYKTDRADPAQLALRYRDQLRWYMRALRDITGIPVREGCLYLIHHRQFVPIREAEPIRYIPQGGPS